MKAIGILWNSMNDYVDLALQDINRYAEVNEVISINFDSLFADFISKIYPYTGKDLWKLQYKISHMDGVYNSNEIKIVFLNIDATKKSFVERKGLYIYENVEKLKNYIRTKYKNLVKKYAFDNVYHMTDDEKEYEETIKLIINYIVKYFSDRNQIFDLNSILYKNSYLFQSNCGKRNKLFLLDKQVIYKETKNDSLEAYAEVFCYHFFKELGINVAEYYFSKYLNNIGIITKNFIGENEFFIDGTHLIDAYLSFLHTNKITFNETLNHDIELITKYNNIDDLNEMFKIFSMKYGIDFSNIIRDLKKTYAIDLLFLQSDRNSNNWGILVDKKNNKVRFAPLYDNSNIFNFNKPDIIREMLKNKNDDEVLYSLSLKHNPTLLRIHPNQNLFTPKTELFQNIDDEEIIEYVRLLLEKIESFGLNNLINIVIDKFPTEIEEKNFQLLINKLLVLNIANIEKTILKNKIKILK